MVIAVVQEFKARGKFHWNIPLELGNTDFTTVFIIIIVKKNCQNDLIDKDYSVLPHPLQNIFNVSITNILNSLHSQ